MLKQPSNGLFLTPSPPESTGRRFVRPSLALYNNSSEPIKDEDNVVGDDDLSVTSLESVTTVLDNDAFCFAKVASRSPPARTTRAMVPGTFWEKVNVPHPKATSTNKIFVDRKPTPVACYVKSLPSPSSRRKRVHFSGKESLSKEPVSFPVNNASAATALDASFTSSIGTCTAEVQAVPIATPISATRVVPCCDLCDRKDAEIQKQLREINELKCLVTQLVAVLGQSLTQPTTVTEPQCSSPPLHLLETPPVASNKDPTLPLAETTTNTTTSTTAASIPETEDTSRGSSPTTGVISSIMEPNDKSRGSCQSTMLRLSRLKQLKEESCPAQPQSSTTRTRRNGKRHVYVSVGGNWGYYCGPALEQNVSLQGCVVRFDNGDLYLGDLMCYVPSASFFSDEHGLRFHGRGALYRKDGTIIRGLFHKHKLIE